MRDFIVGGGMIIVWAGWIFGPILGLYTAVVNGSFLNALLSLFIPWYGAVYWVFS